MINIPVMQWHRSTVDGHCYLVDIFTENIMHGNKYRRKDLIYEECAVRDAGGTFGGITCAHSHAVQ